MRLYEFAKQSGRSAKEIVETLQKHGFSVHNHMATLSDDMMRALAQPATTQKAEQPQSLKQSTHTDKPRVTTPGEKTVPINTVNKATGNQAQQRPQVSSQTSSAGSSSRTETGRGATHSVRPSQHAGRPRSQEPLRRDEAQRPVYPSSQNALAQPEIRKPLIPERMSVADFAERTGRTLGDVIGFLLRRGTMAPKNYMLTPDLVIILARQFGIELAQEQPVARKTEAPQGQLQSLQSISEGATTVRPPIVVVMGHVDHGKTTLLDTIRKTRVAAREKGGITQHLGAYEAVTPHGKVIFLDTPGHEAFSMIRTRGARVADVAVLVVAADDGCKPQTLEALRVIQQAKLPCIVALNKADKVSAAHLDVVRRELAGHGLIPEEWGGNVTMLPISAKLGTGVDGLLELIILQSQLLELTVRTDIPAHGVVIESRLERGLGPVGTMIVREGTLRVGDHFTAGSTTGRVTVILGASGARLQQALPGTPVIVAGFQALPHAGDELVVVGDLAARRTHQEAAKVVDKFRTTRPDGSAQSTLNVIVKSDVISSLEAILASLEKLATSGTGKTIHVVQGGIGTVSEGDVDLALTTKSVIYGLHVKIEPKAAAYAQREGVEIRPFDIIYRLLEDAAARIKPASQQEARSVKKVGEAIVLKVFEIKKMGIIAGAQVKSGIFTRDGTVKVYRSKKLVGEGSISSLQRDRRTVKEVHAGYECAFLVTGFDEWQEGDTVECYALQ